VPNGDYAAFIEAYSREQGIAHTAAAGQVVTPEGEVLGAHEGVHHFTVGQRKGIEVKRAKPEPLYVIETNPVTRQVVVGSNAELLRSEMDVAGVNWVSIAEPSGEIRAEVKIRNRHAAAPATLTPTENGVRVRFDAPQRAVTPGQAAVFYDGDLVLGGGWIV
jgi:tRNA-specific 2-thiouridylase